MLLSLAKRGERCRVIRVAADEKVRRHLKDLGIMQGSVVTPVSMAGEHRILQVQEGRVALNAALVGKIMVVLEKEEQKGPDSRSGGDPPETAGRDLGEKGKGQGGLHGKIAQRF